MNTSPRPHEINVRPPWWQDPVFYLLLIPLVYIIWRAFAIDLTHDEAYSFNRYQPADMWIAFRNLDGPTANNHPLNTLFFKVFYTLLGPQLWAIRLHSMLGGLAYLLGSYYLIREYAEKTSIGVRSILLALFIVCPFLLEYFSLARGYGLSIGLEIWAIIYLLKFCRHPSTRSLTFSVALFCLGIISNLNLALPFVAAMVVAFLAYMPHFWKTRLKDHFNLFKYALVIIILTVIFLYPGVKGMVKSGELYYGGQEDFYTSSIYNMFQDMVYTATIKHYPLEIIRFTYNICFLLSLILSIRDLLKKELSNKVGLACRVFFAMYIIVNIGYLAEHYLLGSKYPIRRLLLVDYPLVYGFCVFGVLRTIEISHHYGARLTPKIAGAFGCAAALFIVAFQLGQWDVRFSQEWQYDADNEQILKDVSAYAFGNKTQFGLADTVSIGMVFLQEPGLNFLRNYKGYNQFKKFNDQQAATPADYYVFGPNDTALMRLREPFKLLKYYPVSDLYLYRYLRSNH